MLARFSSFGRRDLPRAAVSVSQLARRTVSTESSLSVVSSNKCFGGNVTRYSHPSETVKTDMGFAVFTPEHPPAAKLPVLYWLSGLTCDDTNFIFKAGAFKALAEHGFMLVAPDTSPRGLDLPGEHDSYDFGSAAGFYISATTPDYTHNYQMFDYITKELPAVVQEHLPADADRQSVFGHSMGGLGAINTFLKSDGVFKSVSAFSPICNPINCPWGQKAFTGYIGSDESLWSAWDPSEQLKALGDDAPNLLVSQGTADDFLLSGQLLTESLPAQASIDVRMEEGYDHSYYFIQSFINDHIAYHAKELGL